MSADTRNPRTKTRLASGGRFKVRPGDAMTTDERGAVERVRNLAFQRENSAVVSLTLQDARDLRTLLRLVERGLARAPLQDAEHPQPPSAKPDR